MPVAADCLLLLVPKHMLVYQLQLLISISLCSIKVITTGVLAVFAGWCPLPLNFEL
jgi:hypothetical protein